MNTPYTIVSRDFPVTVIASDDHAAKYLALYLISAEMAFSVDCVEKSNCKFMILIPVMHAGLAWFLDTPMALRPSCSEGKPIKKENGTLESVETGLKVDVSGTKNNAQNAAFIAEAWQMMCLTSPKTNIH